MGTKRIWASLDPFYESGPIMGRTQANAAFLDGLLRLDPYDQYSFYLPSPGACASLRKQLIQRHASLFEAGRLHVATRNALGEALAQQDHHVFHLSDCIVLPAQLAALRNACSRQIFPITSVTHSLSYARYGQDFLKFLCPCTTPRDAVVATSRAGAEVVRGYFHFLRQRYGLSPQTHPEPRVEHIPLGVDLARFAPPAPGLRALWREEATWSEDVVFLVLARLCHSSKMDFLPILRAFQRALLERPGLRLRLVLAGWSDDGDWGRRALEDMARNISLPLSIEERPSHDRTLQLYGAADVFLSPADNLQETFGLTLLEAQASGLPVIASDFDGYRDLVDHGETGLLLPTLGPARTEELDMLAPLRFDNHTHLHLAQRLAVDVRAMGQAIVRLAEDAPLRALMGARAVAKAAGYSWAAVAARHVELWDGLWRLPEPTPAKLPHPMSTPYAEVFAGYPTASLAPDMRLTRSRLGEAIYRGRDFPVVYEGLEDSLRLDAMRPLLVFARSGATVDELCCRLTEGHPGMGRELAEALLLWALKHDILERCDG